MIQGDVACRVIMSIRAEIEAAVPSLQRYARTLVASRQDADDLVQECLVRALGRLPAAGTPMVVRPWLFTILHNLSVNRWRALRRWGHTMPASESELAVAPAQEWQLASRDLLRGFDRLSAEHRQVLLLVSVEGLEYREVAEILDIPLGTVMSRLSRARDTLRAAMNGAEPVMLRRIK